MSAASFLSSAECWRHSDDPREPLERIVVERLDGGNVTLYEATMSSAQPGAVPTEVHERLHLTPRMARWLRDALVTMDLEDHDPERPDAASASVSDALRATLAPLVAARADLDAHPPDLGPRLREAVAKLLGGR